MPSKVSLVFLDRDGVVNEKAPEGCYIRNWSDLRLLSGVKEAIAHLNNAGLKVILVTNQRGIALGHLSESDLQSIHARLSEEIAESGAHLDAIFYCPHDEDSCDCRKPKSGLFRRAFQQFPEAAPANSVVIGDSWSDVEAARRLGIRSVFIRGKAETRKPGFEKAQRFADAIAEDLPDAVRQVIGWTL